MVASGMERGVVDSAERLDTLLAALQARRPSPPTTQEETHG
jgi:hypothetical protein